MKYQHPFKIPIGDWSDDGHGHCEWVHCSSSHPIKDIREAFFKAQKQFPLADPSTICAEYDDGEVTEEQLAALTSAGISKKVLKGLKEQPDGFFNDLIIEFICLGNPKIKIHIEKEDAIPSLTFHGCDEKKRHIDGFGYGLFSD